jgi:hypothetical protein
MHKSLQYYESLDEQQLLDAMDENSRTETANPELMRAAANRLQAYIDTPPERMTCTLCGTTDEDEFE